MMKLGKILFGVSALFLANGMMAQSKLDAKQGLDVNKQLQYCHTQVGRALEELKQKDGIAVRRHLRSGVMASGRESSGWTIRIPGMRLCVRLPKDIRNH